MWRIILVFLVAVGGFWFGKKPAEKPRAVAHVHPEREFPLAEHKSFVVVIYAYNQALWCERALRSVFEQEYDHYRVILVDDGSTDGTMEKANQFIVDNNQDQKAILIRNESRLGKVASLYRAIDSCLDREIVIPLDAKDWLSSQLALSRMNAAYQNPDVWIAYGQGIEYPSYEMREEVQVSYYAALFKQIHLSDLLSKGHFATDPNTYLNPIVDLAGGRICKVQEPISFFNTVSPTPPVEASTLAGRYPSLASFPKPRGQTATDILIFSFDRPLQLYACLESIQRYITGFENLTVLYRASERPFAAGYEKVKEAFPLVRFVAQSMKDPKRDFKPNVQKIVFDSSSEYILFGVDDLIVKDFVDLKFCMDQMEKTGAYGFYLRFGRHIDFSYQGDHSQAPPPSLLLTGGVYAWNIEMGEYDWGFANSIDMTLYRKEVLRDALTQLKYKTPNSLEFTWAEKDLKRKAIGLYFERSKIVNIPMNVVGNTGNPHMNYLTAAELLAKFNQGLKIDIEPLYKVENRSPHLDYIPEFIPR